MRINGTSRRGAAGFAVLALLASACSSGSDDDAVADAVEVEPIEETAMGAILAERVSAGGNTPELALRELALHFGPIEGVDGAERDESVPASASDALEEVASFWDDYSPDRQDAVREALGRRLGAPQPAGGGGEASTLAGRAGGTDWEALAEEAKRDVREFVGFNVDPPYEIDVREPEPGSDIGANTTLFLVPAGGGLGRVLGGLGADLPLDVECGIVILEAAGLDADMQRSAMAHEMFHCLHGVHVGPEAYVSTARWVKEGLASWVGESLVGGSGYSRNWWRFYLQGLGGAHARSFPLWSSTYEAIGFWSAIDTASGGLTSHLPRLLVSLSGSNASAYEAALGLVDADAVAGLPAGPVRYPPLGSAWDMTGPGITGHSRRAGLAPRPLSRGAAVTLTADANGVQRFDALEPEAPRSSDFDWYAIALQGSGYGRIAWDDGPEVVLAASGDAKGWCVDGPCECDDGAAPGFELEELPEDAGALNVAVVHGPGAPTSVRVQLYSAEEVCEPTACPGVIEAVAAEAARSGDDPDDECPEVAGDRDPCLVGAWTPSPEDTEAYLTALYRTAGFPVAYSGGSITLRYDADGAFRQEIVDATFSFEVDGETFGRSYDTTATGTWSTGSGAVKVEIADVRSLVETSVDGHSPGPIESDVGPDRDDSALDHPYRCRGSSLTLDTSGSLRSLPERWSKVGAGD